jgi:hypothetical protein
MRFLTVVGLLFTLIFVTCKKSAYVMEEVDPATLPAINAIGQNCSNLLVGTLKGKVIEAIGQGGITNAISVCNQKGLMLTDSIARQMPHVLKIKRTSYNYRNPGNAPDAIDREVLNRFSKGAADDRPKIYRIVQEDTVYYRYYRPLTVGGLCVNCHGKTETMDANLVALIDQKYPGDLARGYSIGDFRGLVCVSIEPF